MYNDASTYGLTVSAGTFEHHVAASAKYSWLVGGNEKMRLTDAGVLHVSDDIIGFSTTVSDASLKVNVKPLENATSAQIE